MVKRLLLSDLNPQDLAEGLFDVWRTINPNVHISAVDVFIIYERLKTEHPGLFGELLNYPYQYKRLMLVNPHLYANKDYESVVGDIKALSNMYRVEEMEFVSALTDLAREFENERKRLLSVLATLAATHATTGIIRI